MSALSEEAIKQAIWDRQRYVVGAEAQRKFAELKVLIVGLDGPGCEIAKDIILTGVKLVTLVDDSPIEWSDLATVFYASEADIGKPTAATLEPRLAELNRFGKVATAPANGSNMASDETLLAHDVVVYCNKNTTLLQRENELCRANGVKFIACETRGVVAAAFVDCGDNFVVMDKNGEETLSCIISGIDPANSVIMVHEDVKHELEVGDKVFFTGLDTVPEMNTTDTAHPVLVEVSDIVGPFAFKIKGPPSFATSSADVGKATYVNTTKQPVTLQFESLAAQLANPSFVAYDDELPKLFAAPHLLSLLQALHKCIGNGHAPLTPGLIAPQTIVEEAKKLNADLDVEAATLLAPSLVGQLNPVACFLGGFVAQQALTAGSSKFTPLKQWALLDWREILEVLPAGTCTGSFPAQHSRYEAQIAVIGEALHEKLQKSSGFIVGAGALGCEHIKNVAMMGIGCGAGSTITVTDMDTIELSNLSRQFLFRGDNVGDYKSKCAAAAAKRMNAALNVSVEIEKVARDTEHIFNEDFWDRQNFVLNALDNVIARRYVDEKCVEFQRPLFESGTLGTKCNAQTVVPYLTVNYGHSQDAPEKSIPLCTLKNTPYLIDHTIQWAVDSFHGLFASGPRDVVAYMQNPKEFVASLARDPSNKPTVLRSVVEGIQHRPRTGAECVAWARRKFEEMFCILVMQLLHNMPADFITPNGQPFWSGVRRPPTPVRFDTANELHMSFITSASAIIARIYGLSAEFKRLSVDEIKKIAVDTPVPVFVPRKVDFVTDEKATAAGGGGRQNDAVALGGDITEADLPTAFAGLALTPEEFEKDDDLNSHIDFITATSNLRATAYSIPIADRPKTKMIAGKIIPAMITTTALVTGLVGIELLKFLVGCNKLEHYRNAFVNIALPLLTFAVPEKPPKSMEYVANDGREMTFSMWDRIEVSDGRPDITVGDAIGLIEKRYGVDICMMATPAGLMVYNGLMPNPATLKMTLKARLEVVMKKPLDPTMKSVSLILNATAQDKEIDLPPARFRLH